MSKRTEIRNVKRGDYFTLKDLDDPAESQVWVRDEWDRSAGRYVAHRFTDVNSERSFKSEQAVYVGFTF